MAKRKTTEEQVTLWTPWGMEKLPKPGERFATLRRLAMRMRTIQEKKSVPHPPAALAG
jgi:hypothetical protein